MAQPKIVVKTGVLDSVLNAGPFVQLLLLILIALSIASWAIIIVKRRQLNRIAKENERFTDFFWRSASLEAAAARVREFEASAVAAVFGAAFSELQKIVDAPINRSSDRTEGEMVPSHGNADFAASESPSVHPSMARGSHSSEFNPQSSNQGLLFGLDNLERTLRKATDTELSKAEKHLSFLATTGSTAPFIGLLGTVVGIMSSFGQIAASGSASLAVVAPGISEALFATAVGLFAALPAVAAYNFFVGQVRKIELSISNFASDFLNVAKRNYFREG